MAYFYKPDGQTPKGEKALDNAWSMLGPFITKLEEKHPDLREKVGDAFDTLMLDHVENATSGGFKDETPFVEE